MLAEETETSALDPAKLTGDLNAGQGLARATETCPSNRVSSSCLERRSAAAATECEVRAPSVVEVDATTHTAACAAVQASTIAAGMCAGADSIDDLGNCTGRMDKVLNTIYAPFTLGLFLHTFTHDHVPQLHAVTDRFTAGLIRT